MAAREDRDRRDEEPPFSRIFVVCPKTCTEQELADAFTKFGHVEKVRVIKDKRSGQPKGIAYIKFDKASSAAEAIEEMNGTRLSTDSAPLKVIIAESRDGGYDRRPDDTETLNAEDLPPRSRLFLSVSKSVTDQDLRGKLRDLPHFEFARIVRDKGIAFVKFSRASAAAKLLEDILANGEIDGLKIHKATFAEPKGKHRQNDRFEHDRDRYDSQYRNPGRDRRSPPPRRNYERGSPPRGNDRMRGRDRGFERERERAPFDDGYSGRRRREESPPPSYGRPRSPPPPMFTDPYLGSNMLQAPPIVPSSQPSLVDLLSALAPQMAMSNNPQLALAAHLIAAAGTQGTGNTLATPALQAPAAKQRLYVVVHKSVTQDQLARLFSRYPGMEYCDLKRDRSTGEPKGFAFINYSTANAAALAVQNLDNMEFPAGYRLRVMFAQPLGGDKFGQDSFPGQQTSDDMSMMYANNFSNGSSGAYGLPQQPTLQPLAPSPQPQYNDTMRDVGGGSSSYALGQGTNSTNDAESRLFVVIGKGVSDVVLHEMFARFGQLEYVRMQPNKNYGYVKYTTSQAAKMAVDCLNGTEVFGFVMKVMIADPPSSSRDTRKRGRSDD
mmetsp:Transcript_15110/g.24871  ORF Transcript_15110/g.24871 Transcript_15110/m.24871 type:complete len:608 (-) Transcript_15110:1241-3064(-)